MPAAIESHSGIDSAKATSRRPGLRTAPRPTTNLDAIRPSRTLASFAGRNLSTQATAFVRRSGLPGHNHHHHQGNERSRCGAKAGDFHGFDSAPLAAVIGGAKNRM